MRIAKKNPGSLVSTIKVEPEMFQSSPSNPFSVRTTDIALRKKAKIFSDPVVLLERLNFETESEATNRVQKEPKKRRRVDVEMMFQCDLCPKLYSRKHHLLMHLKIHKKKASHARKGICKICNKPVNSITRHMRAHEEKPICPICKKGVVKDFLKKHMKAHDKSRWKCTDCGEIFGDQETLRRHKLMQHYDGKLFKCHCGSIYNKKQVMERHMKMSHDDKKMTCEVCGKVYPHIVGLRDHWKKKHLQTHGPLEPPVERCPFTCDKCGRKFYRREHIETHFIVQHQRLRRFYCDFCPRYYWIKSVLAGHIQRVHLKLVRFVCNICDKKSSSKAALQIHMLQHGLKVECKICHKLVANIVNHLECHVQVECPICKQICTKQTIGQHKQRHKEDHIKRKRKALLPYECDLCNYQTNRKPQLRKHMLNHKANTECNVCHKMVRDVKQHMTTHDLVECPKCSKKVARVKLKRHLKKHKK